jgi:UDP-glucose 4-epimerase
VMEIIRACEAVTGQTVKFDVVARRPGDPPALVASPEKLKGRLGWRPQYTDIKDTIATAWRWHQAHPSGYRGKR